MSNLGPPQGGLATVIGDRIIIDSVDLDFPNTIGSLNQVLTITDVANGTLNWQTPTTAAPTNAQYLALATDATLTDERVFTPSTGLTAVDAGAGSTYTLTADLSTGVSGGQSVIGGSASDEDLTLQSTSNATRGSIFFGSAATSAYDEVNDRLGIGTPTPATKLAVKSSGTATILQIQDSTDTIGFAVVESAGPFIQAQVGIGSAGLPGLGFLVDSNTGIFRPAADNFAITTNGTERLRIDSLGNVGLKLQNPGITGTTSGDGVLHLATATIIPTGTLTGGGALFYSTSGVMHILEADGTDITLTAGVTDHGALTGLADDDHTQYALLAGRGTGQTLIGGVNANNNLTLQSTSNATKGFVLVTDGSNVGIGPNAGSPATLLLVREDQNSATVITLENRTSGTAGQASMNIGANVIGTTRFLGLNMFSSGHSGTNFGVSGGSYGLIQTDSAATGGLVIGAKGTNNFILGTNNLAAITIDSTQQVGIGIDSPSEILHVKKDQNAATASILENANTGVTARASAQVSADASNIIATAYSDAATANVFGIAVIGSTSLLATKPSGTGATNLFIGSIATAGLAGDIIFGTTNIVRMRVLAAGGILISNDLELDGALNHDGSTAGFYGTVPVSQASAVGQLTDSTGGTANSTVVAVPAVNGSGATTAQEAAINDNFADLISKINALENVVNTANGVGLTA